ncbi:MAG: phage recombination protein Bet [Intestinibacter bartlettii]|jgi:phage recombination protein Bet|uniref:phage recombination protein Bet n=1 Tax=Intestinibacter bartlettii TaxID=261299 RepID=UPI002069388D|nr:phage recombination protein Bet [Intestinibacter bartlettii]DAJ54452.1 MAG TPA: RecT protein [Caudoviricetes sp.]DAR75333.1 MAG TPA: RecT protein [Caudoviricetes sp.]
MTKAVQKTNALDLASFTLEGGQVLNAETVKNYICPRATQQEILMFLELCKAQKLNPFIRDAYLVKYGDQAANIIVGKDVFIKKAYASGVFRYMKAGIVVVDKDRNIIEREGTIKLPDETLVGGWCEVSRSDREFPMHHTASLEEYIQKTKNGTPNKMWSEKPCTMIRKVAQSQCLRESFPDELQGLYQQEEMGYEGRLSEREIKPGMASTQQKNQIMALAAQKGLFDYGDLKNTVELEKFCESNGYSLKELKFEEVDELIDLLSKYEPIQDKVQDVDYTEEPIEETEDNGQIEGQQVMDM